MQTQTLRNPRLLAHRPQLAGWNDAQRQAWEACHALYSAFLALCEVAPGIMTAETVTAAYQVWQGAERDASWLFGYGPEDESLTDSEFPYQQPEIKL